MSTSGMSLHDLVVSQYFGSTGGAPSPGATSRDPELRKLITELEKIQGRYLLEENKQAAKAEIEVLKAQTRYAAELLDFERQLATLDQKDATSQRDALVKIRSELIKARAKLAEERSNWNSRAFDKAIRAASDASLAGKDPNSAAWQSLSDGLIADADSTVLDPELPATLEQMSQKWPNGVQFDDDLKITSWGTVTDPDTRRFVWEQAERARNIRSSRRNTEKSYNDTDATINRLIAATQTGNWSGMSQDDRDKHIEEVRKQFKAFSGYVTEYDKVSPYDKARRKRIAAEAEHERFEERADRLDWAWKQYQGIDTPKAQADRLKIGQAIYEIQDWAKSNNIPIGQAFDDDGDGKVDRYIATDGDAKAIVAWQRQLERGAGKYGIKGGRTGTMVQFEVKASPEQLRHLRDDQEMYNYYEDKGRRVYLTQGQVSQLKKGTAQSTVLKATKDGKEVFFVRLPDGKILDADAKTGETFVVPEDQLTDITEVGLLSSSMTKSIIENEVIDEDAVSKDLYRSGEPSMTREPVPQISQTAEHPPITITRTGEQMKIHAGDMVNNPRGAIRLLGGEVVSKEQLAGPVTVLYTEPDATLLGPEGLWATRTKEIQQAQADAFVEEHEGGLLRKKPVTRVVGGIEYEDRGLGETSLLEKAFGKITFDKGAPTLADKRLERARERKEGIDELEEELAYQKSELTKLEETGVGESDPGLLRQKQIEVKKLENEIERKRRRHDALSSDEAKRVEAKERRKEPVAPLEEAGKDPPSPPEKVEEPPKHPYEEWLHADDGKYRGYRWVLKDDEVTLFDPIGNKVENVSFTPEDEVFAAILKTRPKARYRDDSKTNYEGVIYELGYDGVIRYITPEFEPGSYDEEIDKIDSDKNLTPKQREAKKKKLIQDQGKKRVVTVDKENKYYKSLKQKIDKSPMPAPSKDALVVAKDPAGTELIIKPKKAPEPPDDQMALGDPEISEEPPDTPLAEQASIWEKAPDTGEELTPDQRKERLKQIALIDRKRRDILKKDEATEEDKLAFWNMEPASPTSDLSKQGAEGVPSETGDSEDPFKGKSPKEEEKKD